MPEKNTNDPTNYPETNKTPLAPVEWLDYLEFSKMGNGWEIDLITNDGQRFSIGYLLRYKNTNQYVLMLQWLNCVPSFGAYRWVLDYVESYATGHNIRLYLDSKY